MCAAIANNNIPYALNDKHADGITSVCTLETYSYMVDVTCCGKSYNCGYSCLCYAEIITSHYLCYIR